MENSKLISISKLSKEKGGPLDVSAQLLYRLARCGEIPVVRLGRRVLVPTYWVEKMTAETKL